MRARVNATCARPVIAPIRRSRPRKAIPPELHAQALRFYLEGNGLRRIGRVLGVNHQTVTNWINAAALKVPATPPQPATSEVIELDELYTFVGQKKTNST